MIPDYITLYGQRYARNQRLLTLTVFDRQSGNGTYKITRAGIFLSDMANQERVFIRRDGFGPVSVSMVQHKGKNRRFFMHSTATKDEQWLALPSCYMAQCDGARETAKAIFGYAPLTA
jgi:hypothetical protein